MPIKLKRVEKKAVEAVGLKLAKFLETELYAIAQRELLGINSKVLLEKTARSLIGGGRYSVIEQIAQEEIKSFLTSPTVKKQICDEVRELLRKIGTTEIARAVVEQAFENINFKSTEGGYDY